MKSIILTNFILIVIPKLTYYFLKSILYCFGGYLPNLLIVYHVITEIYYRKLYSLLFRLSTDAFGTAGRWRIRCYISYHSFLGDFYFESFNTLPFTPDLPEFLKSHIPCISMPPEFLKPDFTFIWNHESLDIENCIYQQKCIIYFLLSKSYTLNYLKQ